MRFPGIGKGFIVQRQDRDTFIAFHIVRPRTIDRVNLHFFFCIRSNRRVRVPGVGSFPLSFSAEVFHSILFFALAIKNGNRRGIVLINCKIQVAIFHNISRRVLRECCASGVPDSSRLRWPWMRFLLGIFNRGHPPIVYCKSCQPHDYIMHPVLPYIIDRQTLIYLS